MAHDLVAKVPPQDLDAESAVLGAILISPEASDIVAQIIKAEAFYKKANALIYQAMMELRSTNQPFDVVILKSELQSRGLLEEVGGAGYLSELVDAVPNAANAEYYAKSVRDKAMLRQLISTTAEIQSDAYGSQRSTEELLDNAEQKVFEVTQRRELTGAAEISEVVHEVFEHLKTLREGNDKRGVDSGFAYLDEMTHGFHPGELTILAARPSMGKTSLALSVIRNACVYEGNAAVLFSLEMPRWQVAANLLCNIGRIDSKVLRGGFLRKEEQNKLLDAAELLSNARVFIDDSPTLSTMELRAKARRLKAQHDIGLVLIDYLQLMTGSGSSRDGRQQEVSEISRMLKSLARELEIPVVALAQLSRKVEERPDHKPRMSDLRESGSIEQDADVILLLYRGEYYKPEDESLKGLGQIICAKNRNGPTGEVNVSFERTYTRFDNLTSHSG
jgi:replicative DNA helicase